MGNDPSVVKIQRNIKPQSDPKIGIQISCPTCNMFFPASTRQSQAQFHINKCIKQKYYAEQNQIKQMKPSLHENILLNYNIEEYVYVKVPIDQTYTKFTWKKQPLQSFNQKDLKLSSKQVKNKSFQVKSMWFRHFVQQRKIPWIQGADYLIIDKENVLMSSLVGIKKVNMYKQVKVQFKGDKVNDAGGLLRQWMRLVIAQMFDISTGIFQICNTSDVMYRLKWDEQVDQEFSGQLLTLYGTILGKAILQKIPINSYLDRTLLRLLACSKNQIKMADIFGFDQQLYKNWSYILQNDIDDLCLETYFMLSKQNTTNETIDIIELVQNGKNIEVNDQNKQMYVKLSIQMMCRQKVKRSLSKIKQGLYSVIPEKILQIFQPYEMEMLLYGVPFIDVKDWQSNTQYQGEFNSKHHVVRWFWQTMNSLDQQQLARVLTFSTGSSRTPINGFKQLQSNRGNTNKFMIQSCEYDKKNPYPKGHTCFNRLEIPKYPNKQLLKTHLIAIANNDLDGVFGLD